MKNKKLRQFKSKLAESKTDGFLVTNETNVQYLSGFTGDSSWLLVSKKMTGLITDSRYTEQARNQLAGIRVIEHRKGLLVKLNELNKKLKIKRLGFESNHLTFAMVKLLRKHLGRKVKLVPTTGRVGKMRELKTPAEIKKLRESITCAKKAFFKMKNKIRPGMTEKDIAAELEYQLRRLGAAHGAFNNIVAVDGRASLPHAEPTKQVVKRNSSVLFDWGACLNGYNSDLTRVVFLKKVSPINKKLYRIVKEAQHRAINMIKPGVAIKDVDDAARGYIASHGYGKNFGHGLGHGIGRMVHELPGLNPRSKGKLAAGMVMTIEPGIYLPGRAGIRIEDMVLVTKTGCEVLTRSVPKKMEDMII